MLSFTNNASPIFIVSAIGISLLSSESIGKKLLLVHILSSVIIGVVYSFLFRNKYIIQENSLNLKIKVKKRYEKSSKFDILKGAIIDSFKTFAYILAYMIIFNILGDILNSFNIPNIYYITSTFELTKGISNFANIKNIPYISFLLGFSSFSIIFQLKSSLKNLDYPLKSIIFFKFLHGMLSYIIYSLIFF